ncbi:MAG: hypothetical protein IJW28_05320 [Clostridia bacterium]|nr:hypothetical protein [Clostridia bacterium]
MMSGVEWLYFPLSLLIGEFLLIKLIEFFRFFFGKLEKLEEEISKDKKEQSKVSKEKIEEKVEIKESKENTVTTKDTVTASSSGVESNTAGVYSTSPYKENTVVHGNYLCDFFDYDSSYVLSREQFECREVECVRKKRYSIMDEMEADNIDSKAYQKISEIINQNKQRQSVLDEFNGLSKEMKLLLINSMLNKKVY